MCKKNVIKCLIQIQLLNELKCFSIKFILYRKIIYKKDFMLLVQTWNNSSKDSTFPALDSATLVV